ASVSLTPFPVMLRQIGKILSMSAIMVSPLSSGFAYPSPPGDAALCLKFESGSARMAMTFGPVVAAPASLIITLSRYPYSTVVIADIFGLDNQLCPCDKMAA